MWRVCVSRQVMYNEQDSDVPPVTQVADGEGSTSVLLGGLQKYTMYSLQVLAFTQMGDGPPSNPIVLRTKEDGRLANSHSDPWSSLHSRALSTAQTFIYDISVQHACTSLKCNHCKAFSSRSRLCEITRAQAPECKAETQQDFPHSPHSLFLPKWHNHSYCLLVENPRAHAQTHTRILLTFNPQTGLWSPHFASSLQMLVGSM